MADDVQQWKIPPNVQELPAAGGDETPSRYVVRDHDRPTSARRRRRDRPHPRRRPQQPVLRRRRRGGQAAFRTSELGSLPCRWARDRAGLPALLGEMMAVTREFFKLPLVEKQKYSNLVGGQKEFRIEGYGSDMVLSETQVLDWCDRFYYLVVEPQCRRLHDLWPTQPASFRDVLHRYAARCRELADAVFRGVAKVVGLREEGYLADMLDEKAVTYVRLNLYPRPDRVLGFKPHSEGSMLTVLLADAAGLQVLRDGEWYDVPVDVPGSALVVNLGDTVEVVTGEQWVAEEPGAQGGGKRGEGAGVGGGVLHTGPGEGGGAGAAPQELVSEERPRRYETMKTGDYIRELLESLARGERAIDAVKI